MLLLWSCNTAEETGQNGNLTAIQLAEKAFQEIENLLDKEAGQFWNKPLYGPILLVDPETRIFYANQNNRAGTFVQLGSIFSDTLAANINIANTAMDWEGTRWTMVMLPLPENQAERNNLLIHELFHRIQPEIGFDQLQESNTGHLDSYEGRLLLKLELEALQQVLLTQNKEQQKVHLTNALSFRKARHTDDNIVSAENALELNEGLAEYTGLMLSGRTETALSTHLQTAIDTFYTNPTFVRSFAYHTVPVYGYLLSQKKKNWQQEITPKANLTDYFITAFSIQVDSSFAYQKVAAEFDYNYENILQEEKQREAVRIAKVESYKQQFLQSPHLKLPFEQMNISFDPRNITPLEDIGTVYPNLRVTDNWGILTVENGALLSADWSHVIVSEPRQITDTLATGDGWKLQIKADWRLIKNAKNYTLIKQ